MIYTEAEYFDEFYPKHWGDWRKEYNMRMYIAHPRETGCTWMDYYETGYVLSENSEGIMMVREIPRPELIERFFIGCGKSGKSGSLEDESKIAFFIQPTFQPKTQEYYASVTLTKMESNLDLYEVFITGIDDSSYTKHYNSLDSAMADMTDLKEYGIDIIQDKESGFFFTN